MSTFYQKLLSSAEAGAPVWLSEVRASGASAPGAARLVLRLTDCAGAQDDFELFLPPWDGAEERAFARSILSACVFNLLSARGGRELRVFFDTGDPALSALLGELDALFQLREKPRRGLGKAVSVSERIAAALGGGRFAIALGDLSSYGPLPAREAEAVGEPLAEKLKKAAARAERGFCCGMDVGGTDVKLAVSLDGASSQSKLLVLAPMSRVLPLP